MPLQEARHFPLGILYPRILREQVEHSDATSRALIHGQRSQVILYYDRHWNCVSERLCGFSLQHLEAIQRGSRLRLHT